MNEPGLHETVLLPPGVELYEIFPEGDGWSGFLVRASRFMGDYNLNPPPNAETVMSDASDGMDVEEAEQLVAHLRHRGWVL